MQILVTGSNGFIAKNLIVSLKENKYNILEFKRGDSLELLEQKIIKANIIFHLISYLNVGFSQYYRLFERYRQEIFQH